MPGAGGGPRGGWLLAERGWPRCKLLAETRHKTGASRGASCNLLAEKCWPRSKLLAEMCKPRVLSFRLALCRKIWKVGRGTARQVALVALDYIGYGSRPRFALAEHPKGAQSWIPNGLNGLLPEWFRPG